MMNRIRKKSELERNYRERTLLVSDCFRKYYYHITSSQKQLQRPVGRDLPQSWCFALLDHSQAFLGS